MRRFLIALSALCLLVPMVATASTMNLSQYGPNTLNVGLVGWWTFDGKDTNWSTGKTNDMSGNGNNGSVISMSTTTSPVTGKIGQALRFDGTSAYVSLPANPISSMSSANTICLWANTTAGNNQTLLSLYTDVNNNVEVSLDTFNRLRVSYDYGGTLLGYRSVSSIFSAGSWSHVCTVFTGSSLLFYVNTASSSKLIASNPGAVAGFAIGSASNVTPSSPWTGIIDDVRVYNRALSVQEVADLYNTTGGGKSNVSQIGPQNLNAGLVGWWTFDGKDTNWATGKVFDKSGNGNDGSLVNMSTTTSPVMGKLGQGLGFNGTNSYVSIPTPPTLSGAFTVSQWVNWTDTSIIFLQALWGGSGSALEIVPGNTSQLIIRGDAIISSTVNLTSTFKARTWYQVIVTRDVSNNLRVYVNGSDVTSGTYSNSDTYTFRRIGERGDNALTLNGLIDDVRVYNRALSVAEVRQLYSTTGGGKQNTSVVGGGNLNSGMAAWYTMDGKDTSWGTNTTNDMSGNGNTANLVNLSTTTSPVSGKMGQGLSFISGSSQFIRTPLTTAIGTGSYSYSVWFKTSKSQLAGIVSRRAAVGSPQFAISMSNSSISGAGQVISIVDDDGTFTRSGVSSATYADGHWHFAVIVRDANTSTTVGYIDGIQAITTNATTIPNLTGTDNIMIGAAGNGGTNASFFFTGSLDDARIYNRALSAREVVGLYNLGR